MIVCVGSGEGGMWMSVGITDMCVRVHAVTEAF